MRVKIETSVRHIHLSKEDAEFLFGEGYKFNNVKDLSVTGEYSCQESVDIKACDKIFKGVRIILPLRTKTQLEISKTDAINLGIKAPVRLSGDLRGATKITIINNKNKVNRECVIIAKRHLHINEENAKKSNLRSNDVVNLKINGERAATLKNIIVRVNKSTDTVIHLDTDESNSIDNVELGFIFKE